MAELTKRYEEFRLMFSTAHHTNKAASEALRDDFVAVTSEECAYNLEQKLFHVERLKERGADTLALRARQAAAFHRCMIRSRLVDRVETRDFLVDCYRDAKQFMIKDIELARQMLVLLNLMFDSLVSSSGTSDTALSS